MSPNIIISTDDILCNFNAENLHNAIIYLLLPIQNSGKLRKKLFHKLFYFNSNIFFRITFRYKRIITW